MDQCALVVSFLFQDSDFLSDVKIVGSDCSCFYSSYTLLQITFPVLSGLSFDTVIMAETDKPEIQTALDVAKKGYIMVFSWPKGSAL